MRTKELQNLIKNRLMEILIAKNKIINLSNHVDFLKEQPNDLNFFQRFFCCEVSERDFLIDLSTRDIERYKNEILIKLMDLKQRLYISNPLMFELGFRVNIQKQIVCALENHILDQYEKDLCDNILFAINPTELSDFQDKFIKINDNEFLCKSIGNERGIIYELGNFEG